MQLIHFTWPVLPTPLSPSLSLSLSLPRLFPLLKSTNGGVRMWTPGITDLLKVTRSGLLVRRFCPNPPESPWPADLALEKPVHGGLIRLPPSWKDSALPCRKDRTASRRCRHTKAGVVGERLVCLCSNTAVCFLCRFCLSGFLSPCTVRVCVSLSLSLYSLPPSVFTCVCVCACLGFNASRIKRRLCRLRFDVLFVLVCLSLSVAGWFLWIYLPFLCSLLSRKGRADGIRSWDI